MSFALFQLSVLWPDGHESSFARHCLDSRSFHTVKTRSQPKKTLWNAHTFKNIPRYSYVEICNNDAVTLRWLKGALISTVEVTCKQFVIGKIVVYS